MRDKDKTKEQLVNELVGMRQRITELEATAGERVEEALAQQARELARSNAFITALSQVAARIDITPDPDQVMETLGTELEKLGITCIVGMLEPDGQAMIIRYTSMEQELLAAGEKLIGLKMHGFRVMREHFPIWAELVEQKRAVFVTDAISLLAAVLPGIMRSVIERVFRLGGWVSDIQVIWLPLMAGERVIGGLGMWGPDLSEENISALSVFAVQIGIAIENARLYQEVQQELAERKRVEEALQRSEEHFRALIENTSDVFMTVGGDGTIQYTSPSIEQMLGYKPEELAGKSVFDFIHPDDAADTVKTFTHIIHNPSTLVHTEARVRHKDGSWRVLHSTSNLLNNPAVAAVVSNFRDTTERKQAEEQLQASLREKEVLLKEIHHRVKNNLQVISSLLYLQCQYTKDEHSLRILEESQNRVRSMALVHEQLYQSKDLARVDLAVYIRNLAAELFHAYGSGAHAITLNVRVEDVPLGVDTAIPCGLIVNELVSNSLKHAFPPDWVRREQKGEIRISLRADDNDQITLVVSDNGIGFPQDSDFRRTESMGLHLVNSFTKQLNGTIDLDRSDGTAFKITFPRPQH